jgi:hypothetical protein
MGYMPSFGARLETQAYCPITQLSDLNATINFGRSGYQP